MSSFGEWRWHKESDSIHPWYYVGQFIAFYLFSSSHRGGEIGPAKGSAEPHEMRRHIPGAKTTGMGGRENEAVDVGREPGFQESVWME